MRVSICINPDTGMREDVPQYPMVAVREAILNALVHRDYSQHTESMPICHHFATILYRAGTFRTRFFPLDSNIPAIQHYRMAIRITYLNGNKIPTVFHSIGGHWDHGYSTAGLVLWLDARRPRRNGSIPGASSVWQDLSGNGYDVTFTGSTVMDGSAYVDVTSLQGYSDMPLDNDYIVELVANPSYVNVMWVYNKDAHTVTSIGERLSSGALGFETKPSSNYLARCGAPGKTFFLPGLSSIVGASQRTSFHVGRTPDDLYIGGVKRRAQYRSDGQYGLRDDSSLINTAASRSNLGQPLYISALRIYNRELTEAETLRHFELDAGRYDLGT